MGGSMGTAGAAMMTGIAGSNGTGMGMAGSTGTAGSMSSGTAGGGVYPTGAGGGAGTHGSTSYVTGDAEYRGKVIVKDGCSCDVGPGSSGPGALLLLGALSIVVRRRRR
jgi:MYXO-CTERM domain-containing protein